MLLISKTLRFQTKIMDIAHLVLLKLMKESQFQIDLKFIKLALSVMIRKENYKDAIKFLEEKKGFFGEDFLEKQTHEVMIYHR